MYLNDEDRERVMKRLECHPRLGKKIDALQGTYVIDIFVMQKGGEIMFFFELENGGIDDFSYKKCARTALREAYAEDLNAWIEYQWKDKEIMICPLTNIELHYDDKKSWNVDHISPTFNKIVELWLNERNLDWDTIPLIENENLYGKILPDEEKKSFSDFHDQQTRIRSGSTKFLRILSKSGHIELNKSNVQQIHS